MDLILGIAIIVSVFVIIIILLISFTHKSDKKETTMTKNLCKLCGREHDNEFSYYCSKTCENKAEGKSNANLNSNIHAQKTKLAPRDETIPTESFRTTLARQESSSSSSNLSVHANIYQQESAFAPYLRDEPNLGFALLGFLFPYVGIVVYFVIRKETPLKASSCIKGVIWSFVLTVIFGFIFGLLGFFKMPEDPDLIDMNKIFRQTALEEERKFKLVYESGSKMDMCIHAGIVAEAWLEANNAEKYKEWKETHKKACKAAGLPLR